MTESLIDDEQAWFRRVKGCVELKVNAGKNKVMVLNGKEGLE